MVSQVIFFYISLVKWFSISNSGELGLEISIRVQVLNFEFLGQIIPNATLFKSNVIIGYQAGWPQEMCTSGKLQSPIVIDSRYGTTIKAKNEEPFIFENYDMEPENSTLTNIDFTVTLKVELPNDKRIKVFRMFHRVEIV